MSPTLIKETQPSPARTRSQTSNNSTIVETSILTQQPDNTNNSDKNKLNILQKQQLKLNDLKSDLFPSPEKHRQTSRASTEHYRGQGRGRGQENRKGHRSL